MIYKLSILFSVNGSLIETAYNLNWFNKFISWKIKFLRLFSLYVLFLNFIT
ncbi:hypothetical protein [Spiroplasma ixodetis]|uniref:hypothetical protein n=1 Tax=Spiroplasma ixodetis TaxID=2141 RepID=UPI002578650A|nr:hypothetical protein [Spiroplasma ixodetis]